MTIDFVRELTLPHLLQAGRPKFISAASGLVRAHGEFFAVSDDENHIVRIPDDAKLPCQTYPVFSGTLPLEPKSRKKKKPDLESVGFIAPTPQLQHGALLLVPSGAVPSRQRGALFPFTAGGRLAAKAQEIAFADFFKKISDEIGNLNLEGVVIIKNSIKFFNRGNGKGTKNAVIDAEFNLNPFTLTLKRVTPVDLGNEGGFPISFTDAAATPDGQIWFLAVAEATESTYDDGKLLASYVGKLTADNKIDFLSKEAFKQKPEGLFVEEINGKRRFYFVTDADDPNIASQLLSGN